MFQICRRPSSSEFPFPLGFALKGFSLDEEPWLPGGTFPLSNKYCRGILDFYTVWEKYFLGLVVL